MLCRPRCLPQEGRAQEAVRATADRCSTSGMLAGRILNTLSFHPQRAAKKKGGGLPEFALLPVPYDLRQLKGPVPQHAAGRGVHRLGAAVRCRNRGVGGAVRGT